MGGASASLPPGFRFHPTDEELIGYYLKRKVEGLEIELEVIPVFVDFYKFDPWELREELFPPQSDKEWFFFCPRDRKYRNGSPTNRATKSGYWKAIGAEDTKVVCESSPLTPTMTITGYRKTLVFHCGRDPLGDRTNWVMHEYRLCDADDPGKGSPGAFALCRVTKKSGNDILWIYAFIILFLIFFFLPRSHQTVLWLCLGAVTLIYGNVQSDDQRSKENDKVKKDTVSSKKKKKVKDTVGSSSTNGNDVSSYHSGVNGQFETENDHSDDDRNALPPARLQRPGQNGGTILANQGAIMGNHND